MKTRTLQHYALASVIAFASHNVFSDVVGVYAGAGIWQTGLSGDIGTGDDSATIDELGLDDTQSTFMFVALEHPVPILPNIRIATADLSTEGNGVIEREFILNNPLNYAPIGANTNSTLDLNYTDATLYWEILDNWISLDIGLTARSLEGSATLDWTEGTSNTEGSDSAEFSGILPMAYGKVQFDLPFSGFYVGGSGNLVSYSGNSVSDIEVKAGYMTDGLGLDFGFELGYRSLAVTVDETDDLQADIKIDGVFGGVIVHF